MNRRGFLSAIAASLVTYTCPVCGFGMEDKAADFNICPCCGVEFGLHDFELTHADLRAYWVDGGMRWWSIFEKPPENWNPLKQLEAVAK